MEKENKTIELKGRYIFAAGRRKRAVAQVRMYKNGKGAMTINDKKITEYFPIAEYAQLVLTPLKLVGLEDKVDCSIIVRGGGKRGQAEAVRHGLARALIIIDKELKSALKAEKLLTRDPRRKERKKPGLKKARRAEQWSKR
ncbi:30S ribosomal protein S9 [Candidatus Falkowbacteria bacterium RIFCSPLOWO2_12_FULL_45_10]|uniref:Small ribosomal subunit protein uS9 n=2 Tax=Candidatus Falkowiibacteriota TaxID=1752728 RepID=A0A1F5RXA0_9BACT|nr:MAG: 30S ribosomal protein S9 [Candidatus Falkowbacteria bacterium RIFCSPLOWO2_12_FULL_45_10]OGF19069.1 MAG: 30S ribosomal protein S9 [Candidatus Falkowbacteria bacterium RIFCSPHIGHO2_02_FULL_45_15]